VPALVTNIIHTHAHISYFETIIDTHTQTYTYIHTVCSVVLGRTERCVCSILGLVRRWCVVGRVVCIYVCVGVYVVCVLCVCVCVLCVCVCVLCVCVYVCLCVRVRVCVCVAALMPASI